MACSKRLSRHNAARQAPEIRRIWEKEIWRAIGDEALRKQLERKTGIKPTMVIDVTLEKPTRDPKVQVGCDFIAFGG